MSRRFKHGTNYSSTAVLKMLPVGTYIYADYTEDGIIHPPALLVKDIYGGGEWTHVGFNDTVPVERIRDWNLHPGS